MSSMKTFQILLLLIMTDIEYTCPCKSQMGAKRSTNLDDVTCPYQWCHNPWYLPHLEKHISLRLSTDCHYKKKLYSVKQQKPVGGGGGVHHLPQLTPCTAVGLHLLICPGIKPLTSKSDTVYTLNKNTYPVIYSQWINFLVLDMYPLVIILIWATTFSSIFCGSSECILCLF